MATSNRTAPARARSRSTHRRAHGARLAARAAPILQRAREGTATLADIAKVAKDLGTSVWALLVPGLHEHRELLIEGGLEGLESVVSNYLASTPAKRAEIEIVARAGATVSRMGGKQVRP